MLGDMKVRPFNSIHIVVYDWNQTCYEEVDMSSLTNLMTEFPLKFFSVHEEDPCSAPAASTILELIRQNSSVLQELEVRSSSIGNHGLCKGWQSPESFKKLTKLSIYQASTIISPECAKKIIDSAPKLKAVHNNCLPMIRDNLIPQNMYGTLKRLTFKLMDVDLVETFADQLDHLEELIVHMDKFSTLKTVSSRDIVKAMELRCIRLCEKLLALNSLTLCNLGVKLYPDSSQKLELPVLPAVKDFRLSVDGPEPLHYIKSIDFCGTFPNLCHVHIRGRYDREDMIDMAAVSASQTTKELVIDGAFFTSATDIFRRLFPNVVKFSIVFHRNSEPQRLIANLWPGLQSLRIIADASLRNELDAEIFGLQPAELEFLRHKDKEFLEQVHVPPIRQCVSTLKELQRFQVYHLSGLDEETGRKFYEMVDTLIIGRRPDWNFKAQPERRMIIPRFGDLWKEFSPIGFSVFDDWRY